jgi:hypothetical protein
MVKLPNFSKVLTEDRDKIRQICQRIRHNKALALDGIS